MSYHVRLISYTSHICCTPPRLQGGNVKRSFTEAGLCGNDKYSNEHDIRYDFSQSLMNENLP